MKHFNSIQIILILALCTGCNGENYSKDDKEGSSEKNDGNTATSDPVTSQNTQPAPQNAPISDPSIRIPNDPAVGATECDSENFSSQKNPSIPNVGSGPISITSPTHNFITQKRICVSWDAHPQATHYRILIRDLLRGEQVTFLRENFSGTFIITDELPVGSTYSLFVQPFVNSQALDYSRFNFTHDPNGVPSRFQ